MLINNWKFGHYRNQSKTTVEYEELYSNYHQYAYLRLY